MMVNTTTSESAAPAADLVIRVRGLARRYELGGELVQALRGADLEVRRGEMVAITGASGSGKSTLMNLLGCLDHPSAGTYELDGRDVSHLRGDDLARIRNRSIGFVFQTYHLLPRLNAVENVALPLRYARDPAAKSKAETALDRVGLGPRRTFRPNQMSGGQRQRVAIARALVVDPAIILADEPTGALDSATGKEILALFDELHREGRTILIVTHDPSIAARCPRQIRLSDGQVIYDGPTAAAPQQGSH
jgi:putative ABC transport system ATP-binding protein